MLVSTPFRGLLLLLAAAALLGAAPSSARGERERAVRGEWELLWKYSTAAGLENHFGPFAETEGIPFPLRSRRIDGPRGVDLCFFDDAGNLSRRLELAPGEEGLPSADGGTYLVWAEEALAATHTLRFFRTGRSDPDWEANTPGRPILLAPDGSILLVGARRVDPHANGGAGIEPGGRVQVIGAAGEVRAELPFYPGACRLSGDGRKILLLRERRLSALGRDGSLSWEREVPIDLISGRLGVRQLAATGGVIVLCGTGASSSSSAETYGMSWGRRGTVLVLDDDGRLLWRREQSEDEQLWFELSAALSPDGSVLAISHAPPGKVVVRLFEARTGKLLWRREARREIGVRSVSVAPEGSLTVLVHGEDHTRVVAWDRDGALVWKGILPLQTNTARVGARGLLVGDRWVVRLHPEGASS